MSVTQDKPKRGLIESNPCVGKARCGPSGFPAILMDHIQPPGKMIRSHTHAQNHQGDAAVNTFHKPPLT
jgi:hypothetical protein